MGRITGTGRRPTNSLLSSARAYRRRELQTLGILGNEKPKVVDTKPPTIYTLPATNSQPKSDANPLT